MVIGIDPHKRARTPQQPSTKPRPCWANCVFAQAAQLEHLLAWAAQWPERTWAIEGAGGLGYLPARQLVAANERVVDVQPKLAARVLLLASSSTNKNDPNDARR